MKRFFHGISYVLLGFALITFSDCVDPGPSETESGKNTRILSTGGPWTLQSVSVNGVDRTSMYAGLTVTFSSTGYTTVNGGAVWPASGTWNFTDAFGSTIRRSDGVDISLIDITEDRLVLSLVWSKTTLGNGRTGSVAGQHEFTFTR